MPDVHFDYICNTYDVNPKVDACASKSNSKLERFITKKQDVLSVDLKSDFYINPPYKKKGWNKNHSTGKKYFNKTGIEDFVRYAYCQHHKHNITVVMLIRSDSSSSKYFQKYVGETPKIQKENHAEVYFYPHRIRFLYKKKFVSGSQFSNLVVVWRKRK